MKNTLLILTAIFLSAISMAQSGLTWQPWMAVDVPSFGNKHPRVVTDRSGNPLVLWNSGGNAKFSRWNGTAFTTPVNLNPGGIPVAGADWMGPDIASHGDTVYVVFKKTPEADTASHIYCMRSFNGGLTFLPPVQVDNIKDSISRFPTVTTDDAGNPIIGFMKFDPAFGDARWVVASSTDLGATFGKDVKASGWSGAAAVVCDCCPGSIASSGTMVAMMYRDNLNDLRDSWAGISGNLGQTFKGGMDIDKNNWIINSCPSTGPDGVVVGDTLYSVFMNAASGTAKVYFNKSSVSTLLGKPTQELLSVSVGIVPQNYPRIATNGKALAAVWKQNTGGTDQCFLRFTSDLSKPFANGHDTVDLSNITNADVAVSDGAVHVVWEDDASGNVKYRKATFSVATSIEEQNTSSLFTVFPNPSGPDVHIYSSERMDEIIVTDLTGREVLRDHPAGLNYSFQVNNSGMYFVTVMAGHQRSVARVVVQ